MKKGRPDIEPQEKKEPFGASLQNKVIDKVGRKKCKHIAEEAVLKEYKKQMRS
jgi:hypothetical protein